MSILKIFSFIKSENRRLEQVLPGEGVGTSEGEGGCWRVNIVQILCTHAC
jgi:hypothetical protein